MSTCSFKHKANPKQTKSSRRNSSSDSDDGLSARVLSTGKAPHRNKWIIDSGATSHICNSEKSFVKLHKFKSLHPVTPGDGRSLNAIGYGVVTLTMELRKCDLHDVLLVPDLSYNLVSMSKATEAGKTVEFSNDVCSITNQWGKKIATASRISGLYYVDCQSNSCQVNTVRVKGQESKSLPGIDVLVI